MSFKQWNIASYESTVPWNPIRLALRMLSDNGHPEMTAESVMPMIFYKLDVSKCSEHHRALLMMSHSAVCNGINSQAILLLDLAPGLLDVRPLHPFYQAET